MGEHVQHPGEDRGSLLLAERSEAGDQVLRIAPIVGQHGAEPRAKLVAQPKSRHKPPSEKKPYR